MVLVIWLFTVSFCFGLFMIWFAFVLWIWGVVGCLDSCGWLFITCVRVCRFLACVICVVLDLMCFWFDFAFDDLFRVLYKLTICLDFYDCVSLLVVIDLLVCVFGFVCWFDCLFVCYLLVVLWVFVYSIWCFDCFCYLLWVDRSGVFVWYVWFAFWVGSV